MKRKLVKIHYTISENLDSMGTPVDLSRQSKKMKKPKQDSKKKSNKEDVGNNESAKHTKSQQNQNKKRNHQRIDNNEGEPVKKKRKMKSNEEYYPGMLSESLQKKKFGRLFIPWDSSFGLDPDYKIPKSDEDGSENTQKLKINPLFDLSKRPKENNQSLSNTRLLKIFVGNLPDEVRIGDVKRLFKKCGIIHHVKLRKNIPKKHTYRDVGKPKLYVTAIVTFKNLGSCEAALEMNGKLFKGHHLRVTLRKDDRDFDHKKSIFVGNLAYELEDDNIWKAFEKCGPIESVRLVRDQTDGKGKGFGYVNFACPESVEKAVKLDGLLILNRRIRVRRFDDNFRSLSDLVTVKRKKWRKRGKMATSAQKEETGELTTNSKKIKNIPTKKNISSSSENLLSELGGYEKNAEFGKKAGKLAKRKRKRNKLSSITNEKEKTGVPDNAEENENNTQNLGDISLGSENHSSKLVVHKKKRKERLRRKKKNILAGSPQTLSQ